jgi:hypothetical protein
MELKETKHLSTSAEMDVVTPLEKNNSQSQGIYNLLFPLEEGEPDTTADDKNYDNNHQKPKFGNVSTLDWLKTWRSTQIS